ncbi:MAG: sugar MFS transporter [Cyclobacteriaceae bacterium]|nr:sugar MFS transporter [Cyclobacteriaceae bacterium]
MYNSAQPTQIKSSVNPLVIIGALFFIFGFITWLNSVLIPYLKIACELSNFESYLVAFAFYIAYFVMAIPSGWLLQKIGFKSGMSLGLIIIAVGAIIFIPAALTRLYSVFLVGLFIQGTGLAILQTASNPYVTVLGPIESAAKRISIMGICNKVAGGIAPIILGAIALQGADKLVTSLQSMNEIQKETTLDQLASRVILPYIVITIVLLLLAISIYYSKLPEVGNQNSDKNDDSNVGGISIFDFPNLWLGVFTLFLYVGAEVLAGDSIISYGASQHIELSTAKYFTTATLFAMIIGYLIGIVCIPKYLTQESALRYSAILGVIFSLLVVFTDGYLSVLFLSLLGLANALVWPALWPIALNGLGRFTKLGASLLIMGIAGGALIPLLYGKFADQFSPQQAYWILVPSYLIIFYYSSKGKSNEEVI